MDGVYGGFSDVRDGRVSETRQRYALGAPRRSPGRVAGRRMVSGAWRRVKDRLMPRLHLPIVVGTLG